MQIQDVIQVLLSEAPPVDAPSLTAEAPQRISALETTLKDDPSLPALTLLRWSQRYGCDRVDFFQQDRVLRWTLNGAQFPDDFWFTPELMEWWWMLVSRERQGWLTLVHKGEIRLLSWDGKRVSSTQGFAPKEQPDCLQVQFKLKAKESDILSALADKKLLDEIRKGFSSRARLYPGLIYFNDAPWEWPLDVDLERPCSFTYYDLCPADSSEGHFAVTHPWAHGCRYWLTDDGKIIDMVSRGAGDTQGYNGNVCYLPALGAALQPERKMNLLRKKDEPCIELSPPRSIWSRSSHLPGHANFLLPKRPIAFGANPVIRIPQYPLRVRRLFLQTERTHETNTVAPVRDGIVLEPLFVPGKPGGMYLMAVCPDSLESASHGRKLTGAAAQQWADGLVQECRDLQKLLE